ncbi:hypothetical protein [Rathayibacter sp. AY2B5]|uniref:hypothetical protein n=1 Tax=Rathayibacter sp. AY2B5 TaxID=2080570 RepID=UPI000CE78804|nr:hypothetical protein [Rathayibacter sp. AY2B5]PPG36329.1 hypothetical protein C5C30_16195 [Rathayibacter sp. AY2B5]
MITAFATKEQMAARSLGAITATSHPYLDTALAAASALIREHCGWHIAKVEELQVRLDGPGGDLLVLPTLRLVDLVSIVERGTTVDIATLDVSGLGLIRGRRWTDRFGGIVATFTHGYDEVPATVADLTLQIAARALGSPLGIVREQTLSASVTWSTTAAGVAGGTVLLPHEQEQLATYRIGWTP